MTSTRSTIADWATEILGRPLAEWIADRRASGATWRQITKDLEESTGGRIRVNQETVRTWGHGNEQDRAA
jgi:hypothetical protein